MIRKLAFAAAGLLLVAAVLVAVAWLSLDRIIAANRAAILTRVQSLVGRPVAVGDISVSWDAGLGVRLTAVEIGDDPDFAREPFIQAAAVTANLKLLPLLVRQLEVGSITLREPSIRIIRAASGRYNYESFGRQRLAAQGPSSQLRKPTCFETRLSALLSMSGVPLLPQHVSARPEKPKPAGRRLGVLMNPRISSFPQSLSGNPSCPVPAPGCRLRDCRHDGLELPVREQEAWSAVSNADILVQRAAGPIARSARTSIRGQMRAATRCERLGMSCQGILPLTLSRSRLLRDRIEGCPPATGLLVQSPAQASWVRRVSATSDDRANTAAADIAPSFALLINSFSARDGTIVVVDQTQSPTWSTTVRHVDLRLRDITRDHPIQLALAAAAASDQPNVQLSGEIGPLAQADRLALQLHGALGPFPTMRVVINDLDVRAVITSSAVEVTQLRGAALGGSFDLAGSYALAGDGPLRIAGELRRISLAQTFAVRGEAPAVAIEGDAAARMDVNGQTGADALSTLHGTIAVDVTRGRLSNINVARELLERVAEIPGLGQLLSERLKPKYSRVFTANDTRFEQAKATLRIAEGRATTDDLILAAADFVVHGAGWFDVDRNTDMTGSLIMSKRFSGDVVAAVEEAKYVVDDNGQLAVPFRLHGKIGEAKLKPDNRALTQMLDRALSRGVADDLLNKLLGGRHRRETPKSNDTGGPLQRKLRDLFGH